MAATTADILGGILTQVSLIKSDMDSMVKNSKATTASTSKIGVTGKISSLSESTQQAISAVKMLKDIKMTDIATMSAIPLNGIAKKLKDFTSILGGVDKITSKNAVDASQSIVSILKFLNNANILKLGANLSLFPNKQLYNVLIGKGNDNGIVHTLKELSDSFIGSKSGAEKLKTTSETVVSIIDHFSNSNMLKLVTGLLLFPNKQLYNVLIGKGSNTGIVKTMEELSNSFIGSKDGAERLKTTSETVVSIFDYFSNSNILKLTSGILLFPNKQLYNVLLGKEKESGIVHTLSELSNSFIGSKDGAEKLKTTSETIVSILNHFSDTNILKLATGISLLPNKQLYNVLIGKEKENGIVKMMEELSKSSIGTKSEHEKINRVLSSISNVLDALSGIKSIQLSLKLKLFPKKQILSFITDFSEIIEEIDTNLDKKKVKNSTEALTYSYILSDSLKDTAKVFSLGIVPLLFGRLGIKAAKGFIKEYALLGEVIESSLSPKTQKTLKSGSEALRNTSKNLLLGMLSSAALGPIAIIAVPMAAVGMLGVITIMGMQFAAGKLAQMIGSTTKNTNKGIKNILYTSLGFATLMLATVGVGLLVDKLGGLKIIGYGLVTVAGVMLLYGGIALLSNIVGKGVESSKKSILSILLFASGGMVLLFASAAIAKFANINKEDILVGLLSIVSVVGVYGLIAFTAGKLKTTMVKGLVGLGMITLGAAAAMGMLAGTVAVNKYANENGGWKGLIDGIGKVVSVVLTYTAIGATASLIVMGPQALVFGAGIVGLGMISTVAGLSLGVLYATANVIKAVQEVGGSQKVLSSLKGLTNVLSYLTGKDFLSSMTVNPIAAAKAMASITTLHGLLGVMGSFASVLNNFAGEPGYIRILEGYDKEGKPIYNNKGVAIKPTSEAIADGFSYFSYTILNKLSEVKGAVAAAKAGIAVSFIMSPVESFANILQKFESSTDGKIKVLHFDENGNPSEGKIVDIKAVATALASGFTIFSSTILNGLNTVDMSYTEINKGKKKGEAIASIFTPITMFTDIIDRFDTSENGELTTPIIDENGKITGSRKLNPTNVADAISTGFIYFVDSIGKSIASLDNKEFDSRSIKKKKAALEELFSTIGSFGEGVSSVTQTKEDAVKFKESVAEINDALSSTLDVYKGKNANELKLSIKTLDKEHIGYIKKMTDSMKKVKTPMREYIDELKELTDVYKNINKYTDTTGNLVLQVDKHTESHNDVNIEENEFASMYDNIVPKIASAVAAAIENVLTGISYTATDPAGGKSTTIVPRST